MITNDYRELFRAIFLGHLETVRDYLAPPWWKFWRTSLSAHIVHNFSEFLFGIRGEMTPLMFASLCNQPEIVDYLINFHFVNVNQRITFILHKHAAFLTRESGEQREESALDWALKNEYHQIASQLANFAIDDQVPVTEDVSVLHRSDLSFVKRPVIVSPSRYAWALNHFKDLELVKKLYLSDDHAKSTIDSPMQFGRLPGVETPYIIGGVAVVTSLYVLYKNRTFLRDTIEATAQAVRTSQGSYTRFKCSFWQKKLSIAIKREDINAAASALERGAKLFQLEVEEKANLVSKLRELPEEKALPRHHEVIFKHFVLSGLLFLWTNKKEAQAALLAAKRERAMGIKTILWETYKPLSLDLIEFIIGFDHCSDASFLSKNKSTSNPNESVPRLIQ